MDPNQQPAPSGGNGQFNPAQYDFITNPTKPGKKSVIPSGHGSSKKQRIIVFAIGIALLFILLIVGFNLILGSGKPNAAQLTTVLQQQTEISRVSAIGINNAGGEKAKDIATQTQIVMDTQNIQLQKAMITKKIKINKKTLGGAKNPKTDASLTNAQQNGRFDDAFIQQTRTSLEDFQKTLQTAYNGSSSKSIKDQLNQDYAQVGLLLESIKNQSQPQQQTTN